MRVKSAIYLALAVLAIFFVGCDSDGDDPEPPAVDVSGNWHLSPSDTESFRIVLDQSGNSLQGVTTKGETISGSIEGNSISFTVILENPGENLQFNGSASSTTMSGTYSGTKGTTSVSGTWSGLKS